jgi:hypothetical protein
VDVLEQEHGWSLPAELLGERGHHLIGQAWSV